MVGGKPNVQQSTLHMLGFAGPGNDGVESKKTYKLHSFLKATYICFLCLQFSVDMKFVILLLAIEVLVVLGKPASHDEGKGLSNR